MIQGNTQRYKTYTGEKQTRSHMNAHVSFVPMPTETHTHTRVLKAHTHTFIKKGKTTPTTLSNDSYKGLRLSLKFREKCTLRCKHPIVNVVGRERGRKSNKRGES